MTGPLILIVLGVLFLLNNFYPETFSFGKMWPLILIVTGLSKVLAYFQGNRGRRDDRTRQDGENPPREGAL